MPQYDSHKWDNRAKVASPYIIGSAIVLIVAILVIALVG
jgi:hypothetical protein